MCGQLKKEVETSVTRTGLR